MSQDEDTKIAILEVNLAHIVKRLDVIEEIQKNMQQLFMQDSRNRHDIETLQRDIIELKAELEQLRDDLKAFSEIVSNNSFVSKAILTISGIAAVAVITAVVNIWMPK